MLYYYRRNNEEIYLPKDYKMYIIVGTCVFLLQNFFDGTQIEFIFYLSLFERVYFSKPKTQQQLPSTFYIHTTLQTNKIRTKRKSKCISNLDRHMGERSRQLLNIYMQHIRILLNEDVLCAQHPCTCCLLRIQC